MTMFHLALGAIFFSVIPILMLCAFDPKRRRAAGGKDSRMTSGQRRLLAAIACIPGVICALFGDAAAFLMWLGGCALAGWTLAAWFGRGPRTAG